jgi:ATP-dependent DNA helicase RecG
MSQSCLPIPVSDLLYQRGVESARIEFKRSWNEGPTTDQVLRTICAFANDLHNLNGGYVVLGVATEDGQAVLPPAGLNPRQLERIQRSIRGLCRRLEPEYQPVLSPEVVDGRHLLVLWVPGSESRPHSAPASRASGERKYYVRQGAETVEARGQVLTDLLRMTARVPFDDRPARSFHLGDLRATLVREFLQETGSALVAEREDLAVYRHMKLSARTNEHEVPRNVALMFFSDHPEEAFPGARIEVVEFAEGGDVFKEHTFRGPFLRQVRDCLTFLHSRTAEHVRKLPDRAESETWQSYPFAALDEAVVNAVYHRGYEESREPTKVYVYGDRVEVTSYPGPVPGLEPAHFEAGRQTPQVPARNRRIGEFFKEVRLTELRSSGIFKIRNAMATNGSPPPRFEFDQDRSYFTVVLPVHPAAAAAAGATVPAAPAGADGLLLISIGAESLRPVVERSLDELGLDGAPVLVDVQVSDYVEADREHFEDQARRLRDAVKKHVEQPGIERLHLFYRGPVALAPLLGALAASSTKPLVVYHYEQGRYVPAYTLDRRFLIAKD